MYKSAHTTPDTCMYEDMNELYNFAQRTPKLALLTPPAEQGLWRLVPETLVTTLVIRTQSEP